MGLQTWWDRKALPHVIDHLLSGSMVGPWRRDVCSRARGVTLELGFGSGRSMEFYGPDVDRVLAVEPSDEAWSIAQPRIRAYDRPVQRVGEDAARIPLPDGCVDTVTAQWVLCTIPDVVGALGEARRLLRSGGELHFVEHSLAPDAGARRWQERMDGLSQRTNGGCHLTRDTPELLRQAGFDVQIVRSAYAGMPRFSTWFVTGVAR